MNLKKLLLETLFGSLMLISSVCLAANKDIRDCPRVALMPFGNKAIVSSELNSSGMLNVASEYVTTQLVWCNRFDPIDYEQVGTALKMLQAEQSGLYDVSTTAEVGKFLGAQYMIIGNITGLTLKESGAGVSDSNVGGLNLGKHTVTATVTLRAVNVETLRIVAASIGRDSSSTAGSELKFPVYRNNKGMSIIDLLSGRKQEFAVKIGTAEVSDIQVVNAINKAAWQALYGKTGLITFLDGGKVMKKPPPKGI